MIGYITAKDADAPPTVPPLGYKTCSRHTKGEVQTVTQSSVCPVDRQATAAAAGGFAAGVGRGQQLSINSCCCHATCGPRKFWSDCKEMQHTCSICIVTNLMSYFSRLPGLATADRLAI